MNVYDRIDHELQKRRMSRRQLAIEAGIPTSTFQSVMERRRNISVEMLTSVSNALKVPFSEFVDELEDFYWDGERFVGPAKMRRLRELQKLADEVSQNYDPDKAAMLRAMLEEMSSDERNGDLLFAFDQLNDRGQAVAIERVEELAKIPEYKKEQPSAADSDES